MMGLYFYAPSLVNVCMCVCVCYQTHVQANSLSFMMGSKNYLAYYKYLSWVYGVDRKICHKGH